jgi:uncharacterized protein
VRTVFVDTFFWIARINSRDQWHRKAVELSSSLEDTHLITSEAVLIELLNYFSEYGPEMRQAAARIVSHVIDDSRISIFPYSFGEGLVLFVLRPDKGYSMTDCLSMHIMRKAGVTEVLTHDHHFAQEGFVTLL